MASRSLDPQTAGFGSTPTFNRSYLMAAMRAAVIALFLLGVLTLLVLF